MTVRHNMPGRYAQRKSLPLAMQFYVCVHYLECAYGILEQQQSCSRTPRRNRYGLLCTHSCV